MAAKTRVSRGVSSRVSPGVSRAGEKSGSGRPGAARGPGPYLVRSGSVYLFQIRVPKDLGGGRGTKPVRISLGACPARRARRLADLLAAEARLGFDRMRRERMTDRDDAKREDENGDEADGQVYGGSSLEEAVAEMRGELKLALEIVGQPVAPMTPEQTRRAEGWKGLVGIARELARGSEGNPLVTENADLLKQRYVDKLASTVSAAPGNEVVEAPKSHPVQPLLRPEPPAAPSGTAVPGGEEDPGAAMSPDAGSAAGTATPNPEAGVPDFELDRRFVPRPASSLPRFGEVARSYFSSWAIQAGEGSNDIRTARWRAQLFTELIGDHPIDTYRGADLQAYTRLLQYWPGDNNKRPKDKAAREIIEGNRDLRLKPIALSSLKNGYLWIVRTVVAYGAAEHDFRDPFEKVRIHYPRTSARPKSSQPLSAAAISSVFRAGVGGGLLDEAMLPLLGHLTGRRLGLLVHLTGNDVREKYPGVWVAETDGIVKQDGVWKRVPFKTDASIGFFVLHGFLKDIGFVDWATAQGGRFLFPEIMKLKNPSKSASSYMQRLFLSAGIEKGHREVFHSLRAGNIEDMRDAKVDPRDRRLQAGHTVGDDEHDNYGFKSISEIRAREMARLPLSKDIDFSVFEGLDFGKMAKAKRTGRRKREKG